MDARHAYAARTPLPLLHPGRRDQDCPYLWERSSRGRQKRLSTINGCSRSYRKWRTRRRGDNLARWAGGTGRSQTKERTMPSEVSERHATRQALEAVYDYISPGTNEGISFLLSRLTDDMFTDSFLGGGDISLF